MVVSTPRGQWMDNSTRLDYEIHCDSGSSNPGAKVGRITVRKVAIIFFLPRVSFNIYSSLLTFFLCLN